MKRLLITIDKLNRLTDTETTLMDLVEHFHRQGWQIDLVTRLIEGTFLRRFNALQKTGSVQCYTEDAHPLAAHYDLIWICQGYLSLKTISALEQGEISGVCVFQHYYAYADQDLPYGAALENKLAARSLAVSAISYAKLALKGIDQRKLHIFPLTLSDGFCQAAPPAVRPALSRLLLISAAQTDEVNALRDLLAEKNIRLDHISSQRQEIELTPQFLADYQIVMGESRALVQAIAAGIPAYITDAESSAGYVNGETLESALDSHFLANYGGTPHQSVEEWAKDIVEPYAAAWQWTQDYREEARQQWSLSGQVEALLERLPEPQTLTVTPGEAASLTLHRRVIADDAEKSKILESWLKQRQPSAARISVLLSFIGQMPQAGNIGLAIVDAHNNDAAVQVTRDSLAAQYLQPVSVTVVSDTQKLAALFAETDASSLLVLKAGAVLMPQALLMFAEHCLRQPDTALWYCDSVNGDSLLTAESLFKPDLNIDLLRSQPYPGEQLLINVAAAREAGGLDARYERLGGLDLAWKFIETRGAQSVGHIADTLMHLPETFADWLNEPEIIAESRAVTEAHLLRCGLPAVVEPGLKPGLHRVRFSHPHKPLVSIVIPTRDRLPLLRRCIESLMEKTQWLHYELLVVDNNSQDPAACEYLAQLEALGIDQLRVLRWPQAFNFAAINNFAAEQARGELLLFLNNDIEIVDGEWLSAMVEHALRPEIGLVGARLEYHDGRIQHAGIVSGVGLGVSPVYEGVKDTAGYMQRLESVYNVTAVSAACMMVRKEVWQELGGFSGDEFPVYLGDVDFALKARDAGYLAVWTPYARLLHMGGATRVLGDAVGVASHVGPEVFDTLREKWRGQLSVDISYNRQLTKVGGNFQLGTRLARYQQPLPGRPLPVMMACHKNYTGCGNYRVIKPFKALEGQLILEGGLTHGLPAVMEVAEIQPDTLLMELVTDVSIPERVKQFRQVSNTKIIMEYDDYIPNLPLKNVFRQAIPKDIVRQLRRAVEQADWLVVSTEPLAEAYAPFHHDIRVAKNRLDDQWASLNSLRRQGKKPRVGWAGGSSHAGDLEILLPFMKEMENEVEWVFMGMKPQGVKCEFHYGVPFEFYAEKLATLNLDLALVPLEMNMFNECKSNLRLLELGACGVPVICTDIEPYRCDLPVTRVTNRYKDWMNAIREHLADMDALAARGDALRAGVFKEWMLRDEGLTDWQNAWLPRG